MQTASRLKSIRYRFMSIQVISILLTVLLLSGFSLYLFSGFHRKLQQDSLQVQAHGQALEAARLLEKLSGDLRRIELKNYPLTAHAEPLLQEMRRSAASFAKISYLKRSGEEALKFIAGQPTAELFDLKESQAFLQALEQVGQVVVSVVEKDNDFGAPALVFSQARTGPYGNQLRGVLLGSLPLSEFSRHFSLNNNQDAFKQVLIDSAGRTLVHPRQERILLPLFADRHQLQAILPVHAEQPHTGFGQGLVDGEESYYAYASLSQQSWIAISVLSKSHLNNLLNGLLGSCLLIGLAALLIGSFLAHFMGRPILENIRRIKLQTSYLAQGKLDQRIAINSGDELEDLAGAVNSLTERLVTASEARDSLDLMLRTVIDPLVILDHDGLILKTNPAAQALFNVAEEDFIGQPLNRYFAPSSPLSSKAELQRHFAQEDLSNYETDVLVDGDLSLPVLFSSAHSVAGQTGSFIVSIFKDISEQKKAEQKIARLAYYDTLTGLPNRILLRNRLEKTLQMAEREFREGFHFGLMFLDLDHFKVVNDTLGHSVGDQLLQNAAQRLKECLRRSDTISRPEDGNPQDAHDEHLLARLGGDEFVILLPKLRRSEDAAMIARRIIKDMGKPFMLGSHEVVTPASVGIALYPEDGRDADTLLRHADVAMYHAKEQGRNSFYFYLEEMNQSARDRLLLENRLRSDIDQQRGFQLVYQPKLDMRTGQVCGMEALVRWENEELGRVSPARFIPISEESGLIVPLGRWILESACRQLQDWVVADCSHLKIAVNLSGRQLKQPDLVPMIAEILDRTGLDPALLELELTESMLMETVENTIGLLQQLKGLGVSLAIDDFGTGYSSLSYLTRFPIDTLKIDRSFVRDLEADKNDATIVEAIIAMAHSLDLQVVAEGVETEFQQDFLKHRGCDQFQGFLLSKPVSASEFKRRFI